MHTAQDYKSSGAWFEFYNVERYVQYPIVELNIAIRLSLKPCFRVCPDVKDLKQVMRGTVAGF